MELDDYGQRIDGLSHAAVALHTLADEVEVLSQLGLKPEDCSHVDLYWRRKDLLIFVAIDGGRTEPFVSMRRDTEGTNVAFSAFVASCKGTLKTSDVARVLDWLDSWFGGDHQNVSVDPLRIYDSDLLQ